jgi:hypothetical protein
LRTDYNRVKGLKGKEVEEIRWYRQLHGYRNFMPELQQLLSTAIRDVARHQHLLDSEDDRKTLKETPRLQRRIILVHELKTAYIPDVGVAKTAVKAGRGVRIDMGPRVTPGKTTGSKKATKTRSKKATQRKRTKKKGATIAKTDSTAVRGIRVTLLARTPMAKKTTAGKLGDDPSTLLITPLLDRVRGLAGPTAKTDVVNVLKMHDVNWRFVDRGGTGRRGSGRKARGAARPAPGGMARPGPGMLDDDIIPGGGPMASRAGLARMARRGSPTRADRQAGPVDPDPLMPDESMADDTWFQIEWIFTIEGDGVTTPEEKAKAKASGKAGRYF